MLSIMPVMPMIMPIMPRKRRPGGGTPRRPSPIPAHGRVLMVMLLAVMMAASMPVMTMRTAAYASDRHGYLSKGQPELVWHSHNMVFMAVYMVMMDMCMMMSVIMMDVYMTMTEMCMTMMDMYNVMAELYTTVMMNMSKMMDGVYGRAPDTTILCLMCGLLYIRMTMALRMQVRMIMVVAGLST